MRWVCWGGVVAWVQAGPADDRPVGPPIGSSLSSKSESETPHATETKHSKTTNPNFFVIEVSIMFRQSAMRLSSVVKLFETGSANLS